MSKHSYILVLVFLLSGFISQAQVIVFGAIQESNGSTIPFANIIAIQKKDSSFIKGTMSDENGKFQLEINTKDSLYVQISAVGFEDFISDTFFQENEINLGVIMLKASAQHLDEVSVTARKALFEQKIDRTIVNVQGSIMSKGNSLLSVLGKSPSVRLNMSSGDISLLGKQGVLITIDDKPLRLERQDLLNYLANLSADNIATIELITAPPSNYDAQGTAGIINITTIRKKAGLIGQLTPSMAIGKRPKYGNAFNLSYQKGKMYAYAILNTSLNYDLEKVHIISISEILNKSSEIHVERKPRTGLYTGDLGLEYQLTNNTTIGAMVSLLKSDWFMNSIAQSSISNSAGHITLNTRSYEQNLLFRTLYNFNFRHKFNQKSDISLDYDYIHFTRKNPTSYTVNQEGASVSDRFLSNATTPVNVRVFKTDFKYAFTDKMTIETGAKTTFSAFTNDVNVASEQNGAWLDNENFKNKFQLRENIYAGYFNVNWKPHTKLSTKLGLRYEYYDLSLKSAKDGDIVNRNVGNLFPTLFMSYDLAKEKNLNFSFVNRIQRPGFLILAPYFYFFDQNTLTTGNPTILPSRTDQLQMSYSQPQFSVSLQHTIENTPILDFQPTINKTFGIFEIKPFQGIRNRNMTLNINVPIEVNKWWAARLNFMGYHNKQRFMVNEDEYIRKMFGFDATTTQTITIKNMADIELTAGYYSASIYGTLDVIRRSQVDIGIRKKFRKNRVLTLSVIDVFNTGTQWPSESKLAKSDLNYYFNFDAEGLVYRVSLSIPFGRNSNEKSKRESGAVDELNRIK